MIAIHLFPNGNGRHSRICADYLAEALGHNPFSWGSQSFSKIDELRHEYLTALHTADHGNLSALIRFARS